MVSVLCRSLFQLNRHVCGGVPESIKTWPLAVSSNKWISTTPYLCAEPLKKKKRVDPAVIKAREERKKRKIEKQIRRLEKNARQLKPLIELEVPEAVVDNYHQRLRRGIKISPEEEESRWLLQKQWTRYMFNVSSQELRMVDRMLASQQKALEELRLESEQLYLAAIQLDFGYVPCEIKGPVETPPIKDFVAAEGDFIDISRKWD